MRPVDASMLAGLDGICGLTPDYSGGLWVPALPQALSTPVWDLSDFRPQTVFAFISSVVTARRHTTPRDKESIWRET